MNTKLRDIAQALVTEVDGLMEADDGGSSEAEWWRQLDWKSPDYQVLFDSVGEETRELIIKAGLIQTAPDSEKDQTSLESGSVENAEASEDTLDDCPDCEDNEEKITKIATDLSLEEIDKKLKELKAARETLREKVRALDEKLYSEPDAEKKRKQKIRDERGELWDRLDDLYDEIRAYTQAKTLKITRAALVDAEKPADVVPPVETPKPFDVEASQRITERSKAKIKELEL